MRLIDLAVTLDNSPIYPENHRPRIDYFDHEAPFQNGAWEAAFPGVGPDALPEGQSWATERVYLGTHTGTHMDAPWHYHPTTDHATSDGPRKSPGIDEVPLEWCYRPGVKLDFSGFPAGYVVTARDVEQELAAIGHELKPLDIVLVHTRGASRYGEEDYGDAHCGMGRDATLYLTERGVRVVGTDGFGWDAPFASMTENYRRTGDKSVLWEGHKAGIEIGYFQMEKLINLDQLPSRGFTVACFPIKIRGASAAWVRPVAFVEEVKR